MPPGRVICAFGSAAPRPTVRRLRRPKGALPPAEKALIKELSRRKLKAVLAINKIDMLERKEELLSLIALYSREFEFETVMPVSAKISI